LNRVVISGVGAVSALGNDVSSLVEGIEGGRSAVRYMEGWDQYLGLRSLVGAPAHLENEREIIILRFGLDDGEPKTLESIGQRYGVTRERIRQIEASALRKLRKLTMRMEIGLDEIL